MNKKRKPYGPELKGKMALSALRDRETVEKSSYEIHPKVIDSWKRNLAERYR